MSQSCGAKPIIRLGGGGNVMLCSNNVNSINACCRSVDTMGLTNRDEEEEVLESYWKRGSTFLEELHTCEG